MQNAVVVKNMHQKELLNPRATSKKKEKPMLALLETSEEEEGRGGKRMKK